MRSTTIIPAVGAVLILGCIALVNQPPKPTITLTPVVIPVATTAAPVAVAEVTPVLSAPKPTPKPLVFPQIVTTGPAYTAPVVPSPTPGVDNPQDGWNRWH